MTWLLAAVGLYLSFGLLFAVWFVSFAVQRLDEAARGAGIGFRLLILPGTVALWPMLLARALRGN